MRFHRDRAEARGAVGGARVGLALPGSLAWPLGFSLRGFAV